MSPRTLGSAASLMVIAGGHRAAHLGRDVDHLGPGPGLDRQDHRSPFFSRGKKKALPLGQGFW
jgi:hypothetical protein